MKILMVCLGNICRSPLAEGILQKLIDEQKLGWSVDSAGTSGWHQGEAPDPRSIEVAFKNGIPIAQQKSRMFTVQDFTRFDLILAMDQQNYNNIIRMAPNQAMEAKVKMILNYSYPGENRQVPDPYYEGGFDYVFELLNEACEKLIESLVI
ncbi:MAG: low molecular weight protein-tyrosine-phosphatase [Bacteroidota bacterium]